MTDATYLSDAVHGHCRVHSSIPSRFVDGGRDFIVYTPPSYGVDSSERFPVLYLMDGQNLFDSATAFCNQDWGLMSIVEELIARGSIRPLIVVGVYNAGEKRLEEYSPDRNRQGVGGGAKRFGRFMVESLKVLIDNEYRTLPGPETTGLGGSSMGGLVSLYLGMQYPAVFGSLIVMSPSLWWASHAIMRPASCMKNTGHQRIWLDIGTAEGDTPQSFVRDARELRNSLLQCGWTLGENLRFVEDEGAGHDEKAWGRRMRDALAFLFPPPSAPRQFDKDAESGLHSFPTQ